MSIPIHWSLTALTPTLVGDGKRSAPIDSCVSRVTLKNWPHHRNAFVVELSQ